MNIIFVDTETNGKPVNYKAHPSDINNWPRITQLAYEVYNLDGKCKMSRQSLIIPDGWTVPKEQFFIDNNMSTERCEAEGMKMTDVMATFIRDMEFFKCDLFVSHNTGFDYPVVAAEMIRYKMKANRKLHKFCTMQNSTNILKLKGKFGFKYPSLVELYTFLFGKPFEGNHDGMVDVIACKECFFELLKRKLITIPDLV